jgi:hypothetical protein
MSVSLLLEPCYSTTPAIYKAATATKRAAMPRTIEPERMLAAFVGTVAGLVEVWVADPVAEVLRLEGDPVPTATVLLPPVTPVGDEVVAVVVTEAEPIPLPAPSDGESPPPEDTTWPPVAAVERDEAALASEDATEVAAEEVTEATADDDDPELPLPPVTGAELDDGAWIEDWLLAELAEATALQDRS